jgi:RAB protein geranylgeranyltransferase component A
MFALVSKYGLEDDTVDFIGHALALHRDDNYLDEPAIHTVKRMKVHATIPPWYHRSQSQVKQKKNLRCIIT